MAAITEYLTPRSLEGAARALARPEATALAGGTDVLPRWSKDPGRSPATVVDLKRVEGLHGVTRGNGEIHVGACTLLSEIASDPIVRAAAPVLAEAAGRVACPQIRNRATIGGNLCNASPAADTAVPLILLDATLELASLEAGGLKVRSVPITNFFLGPGRTVLGQGEVLTRIRFKPLSDSTTACDLQPTGLSDRFSAWDKLGTRPAMEIAVASVGLVLRFEQGKTVLARVGYGSVAPTPLRGHGAEKQLVGRVLSTGVIDQCIAAAREEISPITDARASSEYRREVVGVMLRRMLQRAECG